MTNPSPKKDIAKDKTDAEVIDDLHQQIALLGKERDAAKTEASNLKAQVSEASHCLMAMSNQRNEANDRLVVANGLISRLNEEREAQRAAQKTNED